MGHTHEHSTRLPPPPPIDRGIAGVAAYAGPNRRAVSHVKPHNVLAQLVPFGSRERRLGERLERVVGDFSIVLHSRSVPGSDGVIDHVVVAPSGVWVVAAEHRRSIADVRVARESPTDDAVHDVRQTGAAAACLAAIGFDWVDVHAAVCCTNGGGRLFTRPSRSNGIWVTRPKTLTQLIAAPGPLAPVDMQTVGAELSARLPAAH